MSYSCILNEAINGFFAWKPMSWLFCGAQSSRIGQRLGVCSVLGCKNASSSPIWEEMKFLARTCNHQKPSSYFRAISYSREFDYDCRPLAASSDSGLFLESSARSPAASRDAPGLLDSSRLSPGLPWKHWQIHSVLYVRTQAMYSLHQQPQQPS